VLGPAGADVPCSPVHTVDQLLTHPQLLARGMIQRFADPEIGEVVVPGIVPKLSDTPAEIRAAGPTLGQHNAEVYGELLGLGADELAVLASRKVI
jgi:crotonobetainyl-CoA:carnitine CoA-transferase CaiB-like acyl-CoA transferase